MSILDQRIFTLNTSLLVLRQSSIIKDDKIKINKLNIYHEDCIDLKD